MPAFTTGVIAGTHYCSKMEKEVIVMQWRVPTMTSDNISAKMIYGEKTLDHISTSMT
jgi:hypothetical protein